MSGVAHSLPMTASRTPRLAPAGEAITIRPAYADDESALQRLAALDSADRVPVGALLLAEVGGEPVAALSRRDGAVIADPFRRTQEIVELLRARARSLAVGGERIRPRWRPLRRAARRASAAAWPHVGA